MMFSRALLVALCIVYATSLTPLSAPADDDCALYLTGPGRSSAYDYSLNLLKGNFAYDGQHTCITYEAINQAYLDARTRILVSQPKGDWKAEDFASVGELLLDVSISLARTYGLTYEEVEKGLPLIDTSRTLIREVCPPVFSHVECRAGKYRRLDGLCNNLRHPTWGATMAPFQRLIGPLFADGINAPRISHTGHDLPLSRVVSRTMHPDDGFHDHAGTVMVIAWGQFMDHDYTLTGTPLDPVHRNDPEECCKRPPHLKHPYCNEIRVPDDDYFYRLFGVKCIDFVRGFPSPRPGCRLGSRVPFNTLTGALDGNTVYGVTEKFARKLRTGYGGLLRMNPVFKEYGLKDLLPLKLDIPDEGCTRPNKNMYCFEAGEIRVNEQLVLTVMHTLMAREHNRVAEGLAAVNPHWDDETLFQEARRINIAEIQHITYNEFLPILLGKDVMEKFGLVLEKEGYWDGYDPEVNPDVIASFAAAAYRFGHSLLPTAVERWSKAHKFIASKRLSDLIRRPYDLYRAGVLDEYVMGLMNQVAQAMDDSITQEVTNHLFKKVGARFGMDLVSFNMQRGREFGLPGYMEFRKFCGLSGANTFQELFGSMPNETITKYETIFEHPIDVDLWSGGVSERPLPGSMLGPTFACIIATQFSYSRRGDRFWFELPNQPSSFTPEQMVEIRKSRLARVICDNTDIIDTVQLYPMVLPDHELNPRVPCRSGIIPSMDFSKWAEPAPFLGGAKEYMTNAYVCNKTRDTNATNINPNTEQSHSNKSEQNNAEGLNLSLNISQKVTGNTIKEVPNSADCVNETKNEENINNEIPKQVVNSDIVLKYVYKKGDSVVPLDKTKGHIKNSLKRKKRDVRNENTNHGNREKEELKLPPLTPSGIIKSVNLADFNIKTLHDKVHPRNVMLIEDDSKYIESAENTQYSPAAKTNVRESNDSDEDEQNDKQYSSFRKTNNNQNNFRKSHDDDDVEIEQDKESGENKRVSQNKEQNNRYEDSNDHTYKENRQDSKESEETEEQYLPKPTNTARGKDNDLSAENESNSEEKEFIPITYNNHKSVPKGFQKLEIKSSEESVEDDSFQNKQQYSLKTKDHVNDPTKNENLNNSGAIQEVDLGNFSYESIQVNDQGQVEVAKDLHENDHNDSSKNHNYKKEPYSDLTDNNEEYADKRNENNSNESSDNSDENEKQVNINDGEVKPVIELNNEESDEESDENSKETLNANLRKTDDSNTNTDTSQEIEPPNGDKVSVKQQFERIPLNYKHTNPKPKNTNRNKKDESDGTLDTITPAKDNFDEHLNIKFSDITIKLPEIKLPDDVIAYAREESDHETDKNKNKKKNSFYHNDDSDEDSEEDSDKPKNDDNKNEDEGYFYKPYFYEPNEKLEKLNKDNYYDEDKSGEDLYEKFVRERFGKGKPSKQKSQKLQEGRQKPNNPKLFEKVQNVLKKANEIQNEAEKSGDPKAGYSWTLEYGENL